MIKGSKQRPNEGHLLDQTGKKRAFGGILDRHYAIDKRGAPGVDGDLRYGGCPTWIGANRMSTATTKPPMVSGAPGRDQPRLGLPTEFPLPLRRCEANAVHPVRFLTGYHDDIGAFTDPFPGDQESLRQAGQYGPMQSRSSRVSGVQSDG